MAPRPPLPNAPRLAITGRPVWLHLQRICSQTQRPPFPKH